MAVIPMKGPAFLMTMDTIVGRIHIQNDPGRRAVMLVHEECDEQSGQSLMISNDAAVTICLLPTALQPVQCGFSGQCRTVGPTS
ncbi:hypothetical protein NBRC106471_2833 [Acetobacter pasteurianus subsp. pasteurianus LMG 1262 = NBRC 106471]|nr:hypothetical protein NBRC106471_2833 [Acetobacter pasteurianus subsp. pasteurianus LMG 1262 = NBRC 106471]